MVVVVNGYHHLSKYLFIFGRTVPLKYVTEVATDFFFCIVMYIQVKKY